MPERDANPPKAEAGRTAPELAADVRAGLEWMANYNLTGTEQTLHIDFQGKARELLPALDELVGLVGTLQQERERMEADETRGWGARNRSELRRVAAEERAEAAEARCARLQQALIHHGYGPRLCKCANCVAAGQDTPADSPEDKK